MVKKIVSTTPVSIPEVKELLSNKKQELTPLQMRVYNYAASFSKISPEAARKLINELIEQHGLQRDEACQIVNICPTTVEELRTILSGYKRLVSTILFSDEKLNEILRLIKQYLAMEAKMQEI